MEIHLPPAALWYGVQSEGRIEVRATLDLQSGDGAYDIGSIPLDPRSPHGSSMSKTNR